MDLRWRGTVYCPNVVIPEELYEEYIDRAYGIGRDLKDSNLWDDHFDGGFLAPDGNNGWFAFAFKGDTHLFLGSYTFDEAFMTDSDWDDYLYDRLEEVDRAPPEEAVWILRGLYLDDKSERSKAGVRMADDPECMDWFVDYWSFVTWNEHGNQCGISEIGFSGFVDTILNPGEVSDYLLACESDEAYTLNDRLSRLHRRYVRGYEW